jgi:hypothetical protein
MLRRMSADDPKTDEQRRREILAQARATLERVKTIEQRRDDPLLTPRGHWRQRADQHAAECAQAKAELQLLETLEQRLEQQQAVIFDAIGDARAQALAQQRDFVLQAIARERSERDDSHIAEVSAEFARLWTSLTEAHKAIVEMRRERLEEIVANERPAAAKLN